MGWFSGQLAFRAAFNSDGSLLEVCLTSIVMITSLLLCTLHGEKDGDKSLSRTVISLFRCLKRKIPDYKRQGKPKTNL